MKRLFVLLIAGAFAASAQTDDVKSTTITVYNNDLGVVKQTRAVSLPAGESTVEIVDVAARLDPTSVHVKLDGEVIEQNYQYDLVGLEKILKKYVDRQIALVDEEGKRTTGTLLSAFGTQIVLRGADGGLTMIPDASEYQMEVGALPEGLKTKPTLAWSVNSNRAGAQDVELSYHTAGMAWHAEYVAVLNEDDTKMDLKAWVSVDNRSGASYKNAELKLVAGEVNRATQPAGMGGYRDEGYAEKVSPLTPQFTEDAFFEYHIYRLQRPADVANNETKQISLFEADDATVEKVLRYRAGVGRYRNEGREGNAVVFVDFVNDEKSGLGKPMPRGKLRLHKSDGRAVEFIGEDWIEHTPKKEKITVKVGEAFDVKVKEKTTDFEKIGDDAVEIAYEITVKNRKEEPVKVEIDAPMSGEWRILDSSIDYEKVNAWLARFVVSVSADDETTLTFRVRYE